MKISLHLILITILIFVADIAIEIYVPALPTISNFFHSPDYLTKLTISYNIIGLAISGLFYGALSDYYGRKPVMIGGTMIFIISTILCASATSIYGLILFRLFQGAGQGVAIVVGMASVRDIYHGAKCSQILSRLNMVIAASPALAPILGSFILTYASWKFIFIFLAILSVLSVLIFILFFKETLRVRPAKKKFSVLQFFASYIKLLRNKPYAMFMLISVLSFVWLWNMIATMPFLFIDDMGISVSHYGYLMVLGIAGYFIGTIVNQIYVMKFGMSKMLIFGLFLPLITDSSLIILHHFITLTPLFIQALWFFSSLGLACIFGNATTLALDQIKDSDSSKAMALLVFFEMLCSALSIFAVSFFYNKTILSISVFTVICSMLAIIVFYIQSRAIYNLLVKLRTKMLS